jgi:ATP-dependent Lhr-like helicase
LVSVFGRFAPRLQEAIVARLGWSSLRPVQELAGEALLAGNNAVILAPTAGGKTEASMFPTISGIVQDPAQGVAAIYVAPIKALLNNQADRLGLYTEMVGLDRFVWHGDTPTNERASFLRDPAELLMTTPESLEVMLVSRRVNEHTLFADLRTIVIDEVHAVAGTDRGAHLMSVIERLAAISRHDVQRIGLSATVGNPAEILKWLQGSSNRPGEVVDPPKNPGRRQILVLKHEDLGAIATDAAKVAKGAKSLFFCQSRSTTEAVAEYMRRAGTEVFVHHSAVSKEERLLAEERFHRGSDACIVCTSTLELGIDVGDLDKVLQAEAPDTVSSFLQRMGRTGRRGDRPANTTFFCETSEGVLQAIALVELAKAGWVEDVDVQTRCWPVLIHQLLALALARDGINADDAWVHLSKVPDFRGIHRAEFERLVHWMIRDQSLVLTSGLLVLGPKAERRFGRKNFMELFAVFSSPQSYTVELPSGQPLGTLNQGFVDRLVDGVSCFLLSGRPWAVRFINHDDRRVIVEAAPRGRQPTWGGFIPQFLGRGVCQKILDVLTADEVYGYLQPDAAEALAVQRESVGGVVEPRVGGVEVDADEIRWWTFAGGRINSTLRYALTALGTDWKVVPDNYAIKLRGEGLSRVRFDEVLEQLKDIEYWENEQLWREVAESLPNYRLSKFQPLMPPWIEREVVASYLLDVAGAWDWVSRGTRGSLSRGVGAIGTVSEQDERRIAALEATSAARRTPLARDESRPIEWVRSAEELRAMCQALGDVRVLGLDVETTLSSRALCLIQLAAPERTYLVDALEIEDLTPLAPVFVDAAITKVIHNAEFEREVLGRHGLELAGVVDTRELSRRRHPEDGVGHDLKSVCERELGGTLDKTEQTSDWARRPLSGAQVAYAALDAEVVVQVFQARGDERE